jgi:hypothetical protein
VWALDRLAGIGRLKLQVAGAIVAGADDRWPCGSILAHNLATVSRAGEIVEMEGFAEEVAF